MQALPEYDRPRVSNKTLRGTSHSANKLRASGYGISGVTAMGKLLVGVCVV